MRLLTHSNVDMTGDPVWYVCHDEHHGVEVLGCRPHPTLGSGPRGSFLVARVLVRPWNVVCWAWLDLVPAHHVAASSARLCNQGVNRIISRLGS